LQQSTDKLIRNYYFFDGQKEIAMKMTIEDVDWDEIEHYYAKDCCHLGGTRLCKRCAGCKDMEKVGMPLPNSGNTLYEH